MRTYKHKTQSTRNAQLTYYSGSEEVVYSYAEVFNNVCGRQWDTV